jgi:hypothetical protein
MVGATEHTAHIIERLGVSELGAGIAVGLVAILQYVFLVRLWLGYPIKWVNDLIHLNVVIAGVILSVGGALAIAWLSINRWMCGTRAANLLERPAEHESFNEIRDTLSKIVSASKLPNCPRLLYTPKNSLALEVREPENGSPAVVIGLGQREEYRRDPEVFAAKLGHEISHLELGTTRSEILARWLVVLHFRILAWLIAVFVFLLGFINSRGLDSTQIFRGFDPVFDGALYIQLSAQFSALFLSSSIIFIYSYFFLVRREHIHDLRGSELANTSALAEQVFNMQAVTGIGNRIFITIVNFFTLHPSPTARRTVILRNNFLLLSPTLYPLIMAGILPVTQLLIAGWRTAFSIPEHWWNLGQTVVTGIFLFTVLSADVTRLGLGMLLGGRYWFQTATYAVIAAFATQIPRIVLEIIYGLRHTLEVEVIFERMCNGFRVGGMNVVVLVGTLLIGLSLLTAVRISATGEDCSLRLSWADKIFTLFITIGAFTASSLTSPALIRGVLVALLAIAFCYCLFFVFANRCLACNKRRFSALAFRTRCCCGYEHLSHMRRVSLRTYPPSSGNQRLPINHETV